MRIASRFTSIVAAAILAIPFALVACSDDDDGGADDEGFATLQDCFDEHHGEESLSITQALVVCCTDHPIDGIAPSCGATVDECEDHVDAEIDPASASADDITDACEDYIDNL